MQFRSIIAVFMVVCLIIVTLFSDVTEGRKILAKRNQRSIYPSKNLFVQRLRRKARNTNRRFKRDDGDDNDNSISFKLDAVGYNGNDGANPPPDFDQGKIQDQPYDGQNWRRFQ